MTHSLMPAPKHVQDHCFFSSDQKGWFVLTTMDPVKGTNCVIHLLSADDHLPSILVESSTMERVIVNIAPIPSNLLPAGLYILGYEFVFVDECHSCCYQTIMIDATVCASESNLYNMCINKEFEVAVYTDKGKWLQAPGMLGSRIEHTSGHYS